MAADFYVPIATNVFSDLNQQIAAGPPKPDFSFITNALDNYNQGGKIRQEVDSRNLFRNGIPSNPADLVNSVAKVQGAAAAPQIMDYYKMLFAQGIDKNVNPGGPVTQASSPVAASPPSASPAIPSPGTTQPGATLPPSASPAMPSVGPKVPSTPNVVGDDEGVRAGLYDPPAANGARPPVQTDAMSPNDTVASRFPSSGALVSPQASDPTLGGLVPEGRTPAQQRALLSRAIASGMLPDAQVKNYQARIDAIDKALDQYRQGNVKNSELTPEQKNARASGLSSPRDLQATLESDKADNDAFRKDYTSLQGAGRQAVTGIQKAQLAKNMTLQPGFYSGPFHEGVQTYNQFKSIFGSNPSSALPQEAFNKVANDMLQEQIKSFGGSGVGRVLQSEVNIMKQAIASLGITAQSNRALLEIVSRVYQHSQDIADITRNINAPPGQKSAALNAAVDKYLKDHPMFTEQELQHPATLGAPDAPPQSANWTPQQKVQWAKGVGLKEGDPIRFNGQLVQVPRISIDVPKVLP